MKTEIRGHNKGVVAATRERRPFLRIEPTSPARIPASARECLPALELMLSDQIPALVQTLVSYSLAEQQRRHRAQGRRVAPTMGAINRRRRAARQWIQALVSGRTDGQTLHAVGHSLIPQLAGSGPEVHRGAIRGRRCIEFLRGAMTERIFAVPATSLVPEAKALHALETVLATHLAAYLHAVRQSRTAAQPA